MKLKEFDFNNAQKRFDEEKLNDSLLDEELNNIKLEEKSKKLLYNAQNSFFDNLSYEFIYELN